MEFRMHGETRPRPGGMDPDPFKLQKFREHCDRFLNSPGQLHAEWDRELISKLEKMSKEEKAEWVRRQEQLLPQEEYIWRKQHNKETSKKSKKQSPEGRRKHPQVLRQEFYKEK